MNATDNRATGDSSPRADHADGYRAEQLEDSVSLATVLSAVVVGVVIASAVSYEHEYQLALRNGQPRWVSALVPITVDGILFAAAVALLWAAARRIHGWGRLWRPRAELAVGIAATIAANVASDLHAQWLGPAVAASAGLAVFLLSDIAFWLLGEQRRTAHGEPDQRAVNCSCPPPSDPATSLAEALPLARAELIARGEPSGEEILAERFGTTRHQVRAILRPRTVETVERPSANGNGAA